MNTTENVTLINGVFTPQEAREVLLTLLNHKINFHRLRNFSSEERFGKKDEASTKRLKELDESRKQVLSLLADAESAGYKLEIESMINIRKGEKIEEPLQEEKSAITTKTVEDQIIQLW